MEKELEDNDPFPFGKHKGEPMEDVPASYLHWLWTEAEYADKTDTSPVAEYIKRNLAALKREHPDGVWQ